LLASVAGQDVEPAKGSDGTDGRWRIARRVAPDRVVSTADPDARHTRKSPENRRDGYRAHVVAEPDTGIITDEQLTKAAGQENSDAVVAEQFLENELSTGSRTWYGESADGTGHLRSAVDAGHAAMIKPMPLQAPVAGGFTIDDFTVDEQARAVTCPAGNTRPISQKPIRRPSARCAAAVVHQVQDQLQDRPARPRPPAPPNPRRLGRDPELRKNYRHHRPNVERVISQIEPPRGVSGDFTCWEG
jgi:hypothetical protein